MSEQRINIETTAGQEQLRRIGVRPIPDPDDLTRPYWAAAWRHELVIQQCTVCDVYQHPPFERCRQCSSQALRWTRLSGAGVVYSFIIDHRLLVPGFDRPYVVAQVNPIEVPGNRVRITSNIVDCDPHDVYIGMPVEVTFQDLNEEISLPQFRPVRVARAEPH